MSRGWLSSDEIFSLSYNIKPDRIEGFEDTGDEQKLAFANHVYVFMMRGIKRKWNQPLVYYFVVNGMSRAR